MKRLNPGSIIEIIAPAGKIKDPAEIPLVESLIKSWDFQPRLGKHLLGDHPFLAHQTECRFQDLKNALSAEDSDAIWCYRGGSGCAELLPLLSQLSPPTQQKIFLGFSDMTSLLIFLREKWDWVAFHGPGARQILPDAIDTESLHLVKALFTHGQTDCVIDDLVVLNQDKKPFEITTEIIGGNLAVISHLLGTPYQPNPAHKILLLEDVNEPAYKIRRMLTQLTQAGFFNHIKALLLGNFISSHEEEKKWIASELQEFARYQPFPVLQTQAIGHTKKNTIIPFGYSVILTHEKLRSASYERKWVY